MKEKIILEKGQSIKFLDYTIKNSLNNDGLVLMKEGAIGYECHLGNYGTGTAENINYCKRDALLFFMLARPHKFARTLANKIAFGGSSGTMSEYYGLRNVLKEEGIEMPEEITCGDGMNCMIYFNGKPLHKVHTKRGRKSKELELEEEIERIKQKYGGGNPISRTEST